MRFFRFSSLLNVDSVKKFLLLFALFIVYGKMEGQDIHFSQLSQSQFFSNPAFAGIQFGPRILAHYRNEYPSVGTQINSGFNTYFLSYDQFLNRYNSGLGVQIIADKFGDNVYSRYYINANYAYQARFNDQHALRIGISANMIHQQLDQSRLVFYDQIDPINGWQNAPPSSENLSNSFSQTFFNLHTGIVYFTHKFYAGISARNLLPKPNFQNSSSKPFEDMTLSAQTGAALWINTDKRIGLFPYLLFDRQYGYNKVVANVLYQYQMLNVGLGARHNISEVESLIFLAGFNFHKLRVSYSYDLGLNGLKSYSGGSHELGLRILFGGEDNSLHPNEYKNVLFCPEFLKN